MKKYILSCLMLFAGLQLIAQRYKPVNPNASAEVKKVLNLLYDIKGKYIISGQQNYTGDMNTFSDSAKAISGKAPAIWGTDFIYWGGKDLGQQVVDESIKKWEEGYLVTLMWHEGKPTDDPPFDFEKNVKVKMS